MTSYRRTRSAILEGAKALIASQGLQRASMIEIADTAQVSRATLYNHFRDKNSVVRALLESEVERILQLADSDISTSDALTRISIEISSDSALATMRRTDPAELTQILTHVGDPLWDQIRTGMAKLVSDATLTEVVQLWLVGQVMRPLDVAQSREQARAITSL